MIDKSDKPHDQACRLHGRRMQQTRVTVNIAASVDMPTSSEHGQSLSRLQSPSGQRNLTSSIPHAITRTLSFVPRSSRVFTLVSALLNEL
jgi:hypothetical protein